MESALDDPLVGRMLDGRYHVRSRIARGGMATVYLASDTRLDRLVALKVMHAELAGDQAFVARFIGEAKSVARLSHPNVVGVFDQSADHGYLYLAMEYVPGRTLRSLLAERGWFRPEEALDIMVSVLSGIAAAHRSGIVHRDIKPENVLLTSDGRVKVVDFGLARAQAAAGHTRTGTVIGTVAYLAPEQVAKGVTDTRTDVYAAGIMLFELLTGRQPHTGDTPLAVAHKHVNEEVPRPSSLVRGMPRPVDDLVARVTSRDPQLRPRDAGAFLQAAQQVRAGGECPAPEPAAGARHARPGTAAAGSGTGAGMGPSTGMGAGAGGGTGAGVGGGVAAETMAGGLLMDHPRGGDRNATGAYATQTRGVSSHTMVVSREELDRYNRYPPPHEPFLQRWLFSRNLGFVALAVIVVAGLGVGGWWLMIGRYASIPALAGKTTAYATRLLSADGFTVKTGNAVIDNDVAKGRVVATLPAGRALKGASVTLVLSAGPRMITIPSIAGQSQAQATATLRKAGLTVAAAPQQVASSTAAIGTIAGTSPPTGTSWPQPKPVTIQVVAGQPLPDLTGQSIANVEQWAEQNGIHLTQQQDTNSDQPPGTITGQTPAPGSPITQGSPVTVKVSTGPPMVDVPNVDGMTVEQATQTLEQAGFTVTEDKFGPVDKVFSYSPSGSQPRGSQITLFVGF